MIDISTVVSNRFGPAVVKAREIGRVEVDPQVGVARVIAALQHLSVIVEPCERGAIVERHREGHGAGLPELLAAIGRHLAKSARTVTLSVALDDGAAIAWLYDRGQVLERRDDARQAHLRVNLDPSDLARFRHRQAEPVGGDS